MSDKGKYMDAWRSLTLFAQSFAMSVVENQKTSKCRNFAELSSEGESQKS